MKKKVVREQVEQLNHFEALDLLEMFYRYQNGGVMPKPKEKLILPVGGKVLLAYGLSQKASTMEIKSKILEIIESSSYNKTLLEMLRLIPFKIDNKSQEIEYRLQEISPYKTDLQNVYETTVRLN